MDAFGKINLTGAFATTDFLLIFTLQGVTNPSIAETLWTFPIRSYDASDNLLDASGSSNFSFSTTPGSMTSSITNVGTSDVVGALTDISVSFQVTNEVPQDGYFELGMPKWNSGTQRTSLAQSMIEYDNSSSNYDISNGGYRVPCSSTDHSSILCVIQVAQPSTVEEISSMQDILKINGLSSSISAGGTFTF